MRRIPLYFLYTEHGFAEVVELVDTYGSGPYTERFEGSNPSFGTEVKSNLKSKSSKVKLKAKK